MIRNSMSNNKENEFDLDEIVNVNKLTTIISSLSQRLVSQEQYIKELQLSVSKCVTTDEYHSMISKYDTLLNQMDQRVTAIEQRIESMNGPLEQINNNTSNISNLQLDLNQRITNENYMISTNELKEDINKQLKQIKLEKASRGVLQAVEDSQHRLVEQVLAYQKMLSCKVDRVEIPLLHAAAEKLQYLLEFKETSEPRLNKLEKSLELCHNTLKEKENKKNMVQRMQVLHELINNKVDHDFIKNKVLIELDRLDDLASSNAMDSKQIKNISRKHEELMKYLETNNDEIQHIRSENLKVINANTKLKQAITDKLDAKQVSSLIAHDLKTYKAWIKESKKLIKKNNKYQQHM